ncbi:YaiO family outer membrane beta-barrel protein [Ginsengibacter hankyongi]|uniref:YaiO family outer membrane beta-barrel protein n=1 Tax=Ginsengibacter hankyongi TaxID=2607284 RepID=A0A5J5ICN2_9BACT|nr:YaiO family outer membrane beta-barrel protein [Ginsengibacter hankyongi]KAA9036348.1 YaiO family outer membrane beta-barrel protein [Ginsengibacter hankyongi]
MNKQFLILSFLLATSYFLSAQTGLTSDELFKEARQAAFDDKNYDKAKQLSYEALKISPSYADIDIFLGRVYAWNNEYDSARYHFTKILNSNPDNEDASIAFADLEYWNDHYEESLDICDKALTVYPSSQELLLRKAKNLNALKKYYDASLITTQLLKENKHNTAARALATRLKDAVAINKISVDYDYTTFDKQYDQPWNLASLSYSCYTKLGSVIARLNYANRFNTNGVQAEVDAYPRISKTFYSYVNVGYSGNVGVFPQFRAGFSLYANLPNSFEVEAGMRYLYFTGPTYIYTAAIGKYYKNFLFNLRTYITPSGGSLSQSYNLTGRYYLEGADDFIGLTIGTGISPDDNTQNIQFSTKQNKLSSKKISAAFSHTFLKWNILSVSAGLINQEYLPSVKGNQIDISLGISHRF